MDTRIYNLHWLHWMNTFICSTVVVSGFSERPVMIFTPNWNKILTGETLTMTCKTAGREDLTYHWYKNKVRIDITKTFTINSAQTGDSGHYQCQPSAGVSSQTVLLTVTDDPVILQAPVYVHEGDTVPLRCHSRSGYSTDQTKFYKNNIMVLASAADPNLLEDNTKSNATYACSMPVIRTYRGSDKIEILPGVPSNRMITFMPNRNRIFKGESITMTYMGNHYASYVWIKDDWEVHRGMYYTIASAQVDHSGIYYCVQTDWLGVTIKSKTVILEVINGLVIIQPLLLGYGRYNSLTCHSPPGYIVQSTKFYKGDENICPFCDSDTSVVIDSWNAPGEYRCERQLSRNEYVTTDSVSLHVRELFSQPELKLSYNPAVEGDHMTLTCDTSLSRHRQRTELQFAFYKDGQEIPRFGSSNQYGVQSAQLKDSGNYFCEMKTSTTNVLKRSPMLHIQIQELFSQPELKRSHNPAVEGDHMTLTCDTSLSRHRQRTELQFAFYKNRQNILRSGLSNQYGVQSALLKDSGNYFCEVKTSTTNVLKRSPMLHIQIQGRPSKEDGINPEGNIPKNYSTPNKPKEDKNSEGDLPPSYTTPNKPKEDKNSEGDLPPSYTTPNKPTEEDNSSEGEIPPSYTTPNKPKEEDNNSEGEIPKDYTTSNIIRLVLSGFIVIGVVIVLYWHIKMYCKEERIAATTTLSLRPCRQSEMH